MPTPIARLHPEHGILRRLLRLPVWLFRAHLGWLLGERILLLTHTGRTSGRHHQTPLEVIKHDRTDDSYIVAAGWGEQTGWYRNLQRTPNAEIAVGRRLLAICAERLPVEAAERTLRDYARLHPYTFRFLVNLMLERREQRRGTNVRILAQTLPLVALRPLTERGPHSGEHQ